MSAKRLAIILSHPIQYYSPWFQWLRANTALTFRVFYLSDFSLRATKDEKFGQSFAWDVDLTSGYDWELVPNRAERPDTLRYDGLKNPQLIPRLKAWDPQAILLFGYKYHTHLRLIVWARMHGLPMIFRGDSHLIGRDKLPWTTQILLRLLYAQFAAVTYVGAANREYFRACGVPERKLFFAPHAIDGDRFDPENPQLKSAAAAARRQLGAEGKFVVLFAGKIIASKQPAALLQAFIGLNFSNSMLVFVGEGAEKLALEAEAKANPQVLVKFLPFANQTEMPTRYASADLFVLPSRGHYETWGLAVNEAMHLGVPCLVSDHVGSQRDLVEDGITGWVFCTNDHPSLPKKLQEALQFLQDPAKAAAMRDNVKQRIARYSYAQTSAGLLAALEKVGG